MLHSNLKSELRDAMAYAIGSLDEDMRNAITNAEYHQNQVRDASQRGDVEALENLRQYNNY
jgi:hypothetical protein